MALLTLIHIQMSDKFILTDPEQIAREAERIYKEKLQKKLEESHNGQYVVIDVLTGNHYLGEYGEDALLKARDESEFGVFHLIKIGGSTSLGARYIGQQKHNWNWSF